MVSYQDLFCFYGTISAYRMRQSKLTYVPVEIDLHKEEEYWHEVYPGVMLYEK